MKSAHDSLSAQGVVVKNAAHDPWLMRGDEHLADPDQDLTRQYCMEALEVGRANLKAAAAQGKDVNIDELVARVRGLFPVPPSSAAQSACARPSPLSSTPALSPTPTRRCKRPW